MITIRDLTDKISAIASRLDGLPQFRWGRIESVNPLSVVLDAETKPIVGVGTITVPIVGARVLVLLWNRRATVLGVARPEPTKTATENTIVVNGVEYQACGVQQTPKFSFGYSAHPVYVGTVSVPYPYTPPRGWHFQYFSLHSSGFTFVQSAQWDDAKKMSYLRIVQFFNNDVTASESVGWRLTKIA